jgi:hypothetical protein
MKQQTKIFCKLEYPLPNDLFPDNDITSDRKKKGPAVFEFRHKGNEKIE